MKNKTNSENQSLTIDDIISEIKSKLEDGAYIYRGERKQHCKISSALYREYFDNEDINIDFVGFDLTYVQEGMLKIAQKHIGKPSNRLNEDFSDPTSRGVIGLIINEAVQRSIETQTLELLTELQHYGGKTNLIDFTIDYLIAIFFACSGEPKEDGRVFLLQRTKR